MRSHANLRKVIREVGSILRLHLFFLPVWILLSGCNSLAVIPLQVLVPGEISLPLHINKVSFINRAYLPSLMEVDSSPWSPEELFILDTIISYRVFEGIFDALNQSPLFELDKINVFQDRRIDTNQYLAPLNQSQLDVISRRQDTDALISMEHYKVIGEREFGSTDTDFYALLQFISETQWRIYDMVYDTIIDEYTLTDSITWQEFDNTTRGAADKLPLVIDALREAGHHAGFSYGIRISPSWTEEYRYYYTGKGEEMKEAANLAATNRWTQAAGIWHKLSYDDNERLAAMASFNMALVCEMEDLFDPALEWAAKSTLKKSRKFTREYIELLEKRREDQLRLKIQLPAGEQD